MNEFKKCYQHITNVVKDNSCNLLSDSNNIWKSWRIISVRYWMYMGDNGIQQTEIHTTTSLVPEFFWLRIGTSGGFLWIWQWTLWFCDILQIFELAGQLTAYLHGIIGGGWMWKYSGWKCNNQFLFLLTNGEVWSTTDDDNIVTCKTEGIVHCWAIAWQAHLATAMMAHNNRSAGEVALPSSPVPGR
jgi:hypothetical protein